MLLLIFPSGSFPAGTVMGWPESPEDDKQEQAKLSQHMCFGVPTQPVGMDARQVNRHANLAKHPCNTCVVLSPPRPSARVAAITPARILHLTSVLTAHWYHTQPEAIDIPYCGADGRIRLVLCGIRISRPRPAWTLYDASRCARGSTTTNLFRPLLRPTMTSRRWPRLETDCLRCVVTRVTPFLNT